MTQRSCGKPTRSSRIRNRTKWTVRLFVAAAAFSSPIELIASPPETGLEAYSANKVPDAQLAEMRGKFIDPAGIAYFGISMLTSWQGADGITTMATVMFSVNFPSGGNSLVGASPHLLVGWSRDCDGCGDPSLDVPGFGPSAQSGYIAITPSGGSVPVGGLSTVEGAVQSQSIAGSDNRVLNNMSIRIVPASEVSSNVPSGLTEISAGEALKFADGDKIQFILGNNEIALALSAGGGKDSVLQSVNGDLNQIAQHVLLASDMNNVSNMAGIMIGIDQLKQSDAMQVTSAMSAMKGNGF